MWDTLGPIALQAGPWGLISLGVLSILRGWLIPRWTHEQRVADQKQRADDFRAAWEAERRVTAERDKQISILLGRTREHS